MDQFSIDTLDRVRHSRGTIRLCARCDLPGNQQLLGRLLPHLLRICPCRHRNLTFDFRDSIPTLH